MYSMVLTTGHLDWYYKSVSLTFVDGAAKLVKDYGVLHPVYTVHVILYLVAMLVTIFYSLGAKKVGSQKLAGRMLGVAFGNIGMWLTKNNLIQFRIGLFFFFVAPPSESTHSRTQIKHLITLIF